MLGGLKPLFGRTFGQSAAAQTFAHTQGPKGVKAEQGKVFLL